MAFLSKKIATSTTPQIVTVIVDDSNSMSGDKARQATEGAQDLVIQMQTGNKGASGSRFVLNIAKFGSVVTPLAVATPPEDVRLDQLNFLGSSGNTEMATALKWAVDTVQLSLQRVRQIPNYREDKAPSVLCIFFSDGQNTGRDVIAEASALKSIVFEDGAVDVIACGIGMKQSDFAVMRTIASRPELALNIDPDSLGDFLADVGKTAVQNEPVENLAKRAAAYNET